MSGTPASWLGEGKVAAMHAVSGVRIVDPTPLDAKGRHRIWSSWKCRGPSDGFAVRPTRIRFRAIAAGHARLPTTRPLIPGRLLHRPRRSPRRTLAVLSGACDDVPRSPHSVPCTPRPARIPSRAAFPALTASTMPDLRQGYWVHLLPSERCDGTLGIHLLARRTYTIPNDNVVLEPLPDEEQPPFLAQDRCDEGKPDVAPPTLEMELVAEKARVDVLVVGKTYAPGGKAAREWECSLRIGSRLQRLRILGPRKLYFVPPQKRSGDGKEAKLVPQPPRFGDPEPIKELPLSYTFAYGGRTRLIPDDETLRIQRAVQGQMAEEKAAEDKKNEAANAAKKAEEEKKAKEAEEKKLFETLGEEARRKQKEEKLKLGDGSEGFDAEGVRLWGASASKDGTAMLDIHEFEKQRLADMIAQEREEEAKAAARKAKKPDRRQNALGEYLEADEGVEILTDDVLAQELQKSAEEQEADAKARALAAKKRAKEAVELNDGTQVLDLDEMPQEDAWPADLKAKLDEGDQAERKAWDARVAEQKKHEAEKLKEFPELPCPTNPYGRGFLVCHHEVMVKRTELPQIENPDAPLTPADLVQDVMALEKVPLPAGFGTWPRQARPRIDLCGPYPSAVKEWPKQIEAQKRALDLKKDEDVALLRVLEQQKEPVPMRPGFFNSAAPTLQWGDLTGDEEVTLTNLTKDGTLFFKLPGKVLQAELDRGREIERQDMRLDTVVLEPDSRQVTLLWRTHYPLKTWEELGTYPHLVGWVLDLDVQQKKDLDWAARLKASQGDGTAVLDLAQLDEEMQKAAKLESKPDVVDVPVGEHTQALDLEKMGTYRQVEDDAWVKRASDGTVDVTAEEKAKKAEEAYVAEKLAAMKALEEKEKAEKARREEIGAAVAENKPVPPKDGPPGAKAPKPKAKAPAKG